MQTDMTTGNLYERG